MVIVPCMGDRSECPSIVASTPPHKRKIAPIRVEGRGDVGKGPCTREAVLCLSSVGFVPSILCHSRENLGAEVACSAASA